MFAVRFKHNCFFGHNKPGKYDEFLITPTFKAMLEEFYKEDWE